MSNIKKFFTLIGSPTTEVVFSKESNEVVSVWCNGFGREDYLQAEVHELYSQATKEITKSLRDAKTETDAITYLIEVASRISVIKRSYTMKDVEVEDGDDKITIRLSICSSATWLREDENTRGSNSQEELILASPFMEVLFSYCSRLEEFVDTYDKKIVALLPIIRSKEATSSEVQTKFYWQAKSTDLAELLWCIIESGSVTTDSGGKNKATHIQLADAIGNLFSKSLSGYSKLMDAAFKRKNKNGSPYLYNLNEVFLDRVRLKDK